MRESLLTEEGGSVLYFFLILFFPQEDNDPLRIFWKQVFLWYFYHKNGKNIYHFYIAFYIA